MAVMKTGKVSRAFRQKEVMKKGVMKCKKVEISLVTGKPKRIRRDNGRIAAAKAATMSKEEWLTFQSEKYKRQWSKPEYMLTDEAKKNVYVRDGGEGAYKDKTYEIVTRWTANTRIAYRPHAKAPGSKSHVRYERYAKARTVGEALKLGSYPLDWCFDYEHGFIKVLGGEKRDEPIDISKVEDESKLTDVDRCLLTWFRRECAKRYGLKVADLMVDKGGGESMIMRAHRLVANRQAEAALAKAKAQQRPISDEEIEQILTTWAFARNIGRLNVMPKGQSWVWSDTMGLLRDRQGDIHLTDATKRYPAFTRTICKWLNDRLPAEAKSFKYTSINLNKAYNARRHRDGNNFGPSMIKAFGQFTGGELKYYPEDDKSVDLEKLKVKDSKTVDLSTNLCMFNGNSAHEVNEFQGSRFSVVYFTSGCHAKAPAEAVSGMKELGFPVPAKDEDPFTVLAKPGFATSKKPAMRVWDAKSLEKKRKR